MTDPFTPNSPVAARVLLGNPTGADGGVQEIPIGDSFVFDEDGTLDVVGGNNIAVDGGSVGSSLWFDVVIPPTGAAFRFRAFGIDAGAFCAAFSYDDGDTFVADAEEYDSYLYAFSSITFSSPTVAVRAQADSLVVFSQQSPGSGLSNYVEFVLLPGTDTLLTQLIQITSTMGVGTRTEYGSASLNPDAAVPPVPARATTIRFTPYGGNGDANPPGSGEHIIVSQWTLERLPAPPA